MPKKKILIADDEDHIVKALQIRLTQADYDVIVAQNGQEALTQAQQESPDLIVLDLMMPKMDGHKACGLLKADKRYKDTPIIMLSAKVQKEDIDISKEIGADAYFTKPFDSPALIAKIGELLQEKS